MLPIEIQVPRGRVNTIILVFLPLAFLLFTIELSSDGFTTGANSLASLLSVAVSNPASLLQESPTFQTKPRQAGTLYSHFPENILSEKFLREKLNTSSIDLRHGEVRPFRPHGLAAHFFLDLGTYRSSPRAFSCAGSIARAIEDHYNPPFECEWVTHNGTAVKSENSLKYRPAMEWRALYDSLIVVCHFAEDVGTDGGGGELFITFVLGDQYRLPERFLALTEAPGEYNASMFEPPFQYDIIYCGAPFSGDISPQRVREWIAYHAYVFGERSHFMFYDAGGLHPAVQKVLQPWLDLGRVSVHNVRQTTLYAGYYKHQHTVANDCLFRSQYKAKWTFFFDIDEYVYVDPVTTLAALLAEKESQDLAVLRFDQKQMSHSLCVRDGSVDNATRDAINSQLWAFEKLVFSMHWKDNKPLAHKYAVQGRHVWVTEVHNAVHVKKGNNWNVGYDRIWFHHYRDTIATRTEVCRHFVDVAGSNWTAPVFFDHKLYSPDFTMAQLGSTIKAFELATIGAQQFIL